MTPRSIANRAACLALALAATSCQNRLDLVTPDAGAAPETEFRNTLAADIRSDVRSAVPAAAMQEITGPTVIIEPGSYAVTSDFTSIDPMAAAIVVQADNVRLSLGDHTITGPGNKLGTGVRVDGASNVLVTGGTLRTFGIGVMLVGTNHSAVKDVHVIGGDEFANPPTVPPQIGILLVNSASNRILRNDLRGVNLGLFVRGGESRDNRLAMNHVEGGTNGLLGVCYNPASGEGPAGPTRDEVTQNLFGRFGTGIQTSAGSAENRFTRNVIHYFTSAWQDLNGTNEFLRNETEQVAP